MVTDLETLRDLTSARGEIERAAEGIPGELPAPLRRALGRLARGALRPNLTYDAAETARRRARARDEVAPVVLHFSRGERILEPGERIEPRHLLLFQAIRAQAHPEDAARTRIGGGLLAALLAFLCYKLARPMVGRRPTRRDALFAGVVLLLNLALVQGRWSARRSCARSRSRSRCRARWARSASSARGSRPSICGRRCPS